MRTTLGQSDPSVAKVPLATQALTLATSVAVVWMALRWARSNGDALLWLLHPPRFAPLVLPPR